MAVIRDNAFAIAWDVKQNRYEGKRSENLLSALLCALMKSDPSIARSIFTLLSGRKPSGNVEVNPQPSFTGDDKVQRNTMTPDMLLSSGKLNLIVEVKVESGLGKNQLEDYLEIARQFAAETGEEWLVVFIAEKTSDAKTQALLKHKNYFAPEGASHFFWQDLYDLLRRRGRTKSPWDAGRNAFADFMRDSINVAGDLYPSYRDLHSHDDERRLECQSRFYLRYSLARAHFDGFNSMPGVNGLEQYFLADKPGIEAFHRFGFLNIIFRWDEPQSPMTRNLPQRHLRVFITRERKAPQFGKGDAEVLAPTFLAKKLKAPAIPTWYREEGPREAFYFDIQHWIDEANDGPGLTEVLGACAERVLEHLKATSAD